MQIKNVNGKIHLLGSDDGKAWQVIHKFEILCEHKAADYDFYLAVENEVYCVFCHDKIKETRLFLAHSGYEYGDISVVYFDTEYQKLAFLKEGGEWTFFDVLEYVENIQETIIKTEGVNIIISNDKIFIEDAQDDVSDIYNPLIDSDSRFNYFLLRDEDNNVSYFIVNKESS